MSADITNADTASSTLQRRSSLIDVVAQSGMSVLGRGLYLILQMIMARSLGPEEFGLYAIGWTVAGLVATLSPVGMPQAVIRFQIGGRQSLFSGAMIITVLVGSIAGALLFASAGVLATRIFESPATEPIIRAFAASVPLLGIFGLTSAALRTGGAMVLSAAVGALLFVFYLALTEGVFLANPSAVAAAHLYSAAIVLATVPAVIVLLRMTNGRTPPPLGILLRFGIITMLVHSANVLNLWVDRVVIGIMQDPASVGIYQVASQLAMVGLVLRSAVLTVFETNISRVSASGGVKDLTREFFAACRVLLHVSLPGLVVLAITAAFWVNLLFGPSYAAAAAPLMILTIGQILVTVTGPAGSALHMSGGERAVMALTLYGVVANIIANVALIPLMGASGAALASGLANVGMTLACVVGCIRTGRLSFSIKWLWDVLVASIACVTATGLSVWWMGSLNLGKVCFVLLLAYMTYGVVVTMFCTVEDEVLDKIRRRLGLSLRWRAEG